MLALLGITGVASAALATCVMPLFGAGQVLLKIVLGTAFVSLSELWLVVAVLGGVRAHGQVLACFALGYAITFVASLSLARFGELGLLAGFALGQAGVLFCGLYVLARHAPESREAAWQFMRRDAIYLELGLIGFVYNLAVWIDKLLFWLNPACSRQVLGPLRASEVYDLPTFLAYLTIVPGMAVFLVRVETDFAERHAAFFAAIENGAALVRIEALSDELTAAAQRALFDIARVQGIALAACFAFGPSVLRLCGISELHLPLFYIDALGVMLQVLLLAVMSMLFYLDRRRTASVLAMLLLGTNLAATLVTQALGSDFYGYGFALAMAITCLLGLSLLTRAFARLVQDTFMRQPGQA